MQPQTRHCNASSPTDEYRSWSRAGKPPGRYTASEEDAARNTNPKRTFKLSTTGCVCLDDLPRHLSHSPSPQGDGAEERIRCCHNSQRDAATFGHEAERLETGLETVKHPMILSRVTCRKSSRESLTSCCIDLRPGISHKLHHPLCRTRQFLRKFMFHWQEPLSLSRGVWATTKCRCHRGQGTDDPRGNIFLLNLDVRTRSAGRLRRKNPKCARQ